MTSLLFRREMLCRYTKFFEESRGARVQAKADPTHVWQDSSP